MDCTLGKKEYNLTKAKLKLWLTLGSIHDQILDAVAHKDFILISEYVISYVATALFISEKDLENLPWEEVIDALIEISRVNLPTFKIPLLNNFQDMEDVPWDYIGRNWYFWASVFAKEFGWSMEYIAELDVEDALKLLQEILVSNQLEKEWEWAISDKSVSYDLNTKTSKFHPLERPLWMKQGGKVRKKIVQIPEHLMPIGNVIRAKH